MGLEFKPKIVELNDEELRSQLDTYEHKYGLTSEQFLERFNRGELGHCTDFIDWAGLLDVANAVGVRGSVKM
jgi:hypothetical protein